MREREIDPLDLGIPRCDPSELRGGSPAENAAAIRAVFAGDDGGRRSAVLLNAAGAIAAAGHACDLREGVGLAREAIDSGAAGERLEELIAFSQARRRWHERRLDGAQQRAEAAACRRGSGNEIPRCARHAGPGGHRGGQAALAVGGRPAAGRGSRPPGRGIRAQESGRGLHLGGRTVRGVAGGSECGEIRCDPPAARERLLLRDRRARGVEPPGRGRRAPSPARPGRLTDARAAGHGGRAGARRARRGARRGRARSSRRPRRGDHRDQRPRPLDLRDRPPRPARAGRARSGRPGGRRRERHRLAGPGRRGRAGRRRRDPRRLHPHASARPRREARGARLAAAREGLRPHARGGRRRRRRGRRRPGRIHPGPRNASPRAAACSPSPRRCFPSWFT